MTGAAKLKILFLASQPQNTGGLHLDWDLQAFNRALDTTRTTDRFLTRFLWGPSPADLIDNLSLFKPDIVHFSGHGQQATQGKEHGLGLVDRAQQTAVIAEQGLLSLLRGLREDRPQLLVLASCWGLGIARSATSFVKCGIGCPNNLSDTVASTFIHGFYASIAAGRSVRASYEIGISGIPDTVSTDRRPMLEWAYDVDPSDLVLLSKHDVKQEISGEVGRLLDLGLFAEAAFRADTELRSSPTNGRLIYYSCLSRFNGRAPRSLTNITESRRIESLLERCLKVSAVQDSAAGEEGWEGCALLLWAWLKEDLLLRNGFISEGSGPSMEHMLRRAVELRPHKSELIRLSRNFPPGETSRTHSFLDYLIAQAPAS